jgi:hypothetical protein
MSMKMSSIFVTDNIGVMHIITRYILSNLGILKEVYSTRFTQRSIPLISSSLGPSLIDRLCLSAGKMLHHDRYIN